MRKGEQTSRARIGQRIGRWEVVGYAGTRRDLAGKVEHFLEVRCQCGTQRIRRIGNLNKSNGCPICSPRWRADAAAATRHGSKDPVEAVRADARVKMQEFRRTNAAYYLFELARKRTEVREGRVAFSLRAGDVSIPEYCPITGERLIIGGENSDSRPTLIRRDRRRGWEAGNVLVVSWKAMLQVRQWGLERQAVRGQVEPESEPTPEDLVGMKEELELFGCSTRGQFEALVCQSLKNKNLKRLCLRQGPQANLT